MCSPERHPMGGIGLCKSSINHLIFEKCEEASIRFHCCWSTQKTHPFFFYDSVYLLYSASAEIETKKCSSVCLFRNVQQQRCGGTWRIIAFGVIPSGLCESCVCFLPEHTWRGIEIALDASTAYACPSRALVSCFGSDVATDVWAGRYWRCLQWKSKRTDWHTQTHTSPMDMGNWLTWFDWYAFNWNLIPTNYGLNTRDMAPASSAVNAISNGCRPFMCDVCEQNSL